MTKEDIIRMAREAGFSVDGDSWVHSPNAILVDGRKSIDKQLTRFAALFAAAERKAIEPIVFGLCISDNNAQEIVNAIRERSNQ